MQVLSFNLKPNFTMKKNMGTVDKSLRIIVVAIIAVLYFTKVIEGTLAIVLLVFAVIFVVTSFFSFCPLYTLIGLNTRKKE
jgi:hypothetical protein